MNNPEEIIIGAPMVAYLTHLIMSWTPESITKRRWAILTTAVLSILLSIAEAVLKSHINLWDAIIRGFAIAMASGGAYGIAKTHGSQIVEAIKKANGNGDE